MQPWHESSPMGEYRLRDRLFAGIFGIVGFVSAPVWMAAIHLPACCLVFLLIATRHFVMQDAFVLLPWALVYDGARMAILKRSGHLLGRVDEVIVIDPRWSKSDLQRDDERRAQGRFGKASVIWLPRLAKWFATAPLIASVIAFVAIKTIGPDTTIAQSWAVSAPESLSFVRNAFAGYSEILKELETHGVGPAHRYFYIVLHDLWLASFAAALLCAMTFPYKDNPRTLIYGDTSQLDMGAADDGVWNVALTGGGMLVLLMMLSILLLSFALGPETALLCKSCRRRFLNDLTASDVTFIGQGLALSSVTWCALLPHFLATTLMPAVRTCLDGKGWQLIDRRTKTADLTGRT